MPELKLPELEDDYGRGVKLTKLRMGGVVPPRPQFVFMA
jgi:hypothetical protein